MKLFANFFFLVVLIFLISNFCFAQKKSANLSFCQMEMPEQLFQKNLSFNELFSFTIDGNGKPSKINKVIGEYLKNEDIEECLKIWKFTGFSKDTRAKVLFSWNHGFGWTQMQVSSKGFYRKVKYKQNIQK
jgi:hypothetical protein